ncbi:MAG: hypothetical protein R2741_13260 [Methanolobus sp.]
MAIRTREENERIASTIRQVIYEWGREQAELQLAENIRAVRMRT